LIAIATSPSIATPYDTRVRDVIQRVAVCACAGVLLVTAGPASGVSQRRITVTVTGNGRGLWKLDSSRETGRLALEYRWHGTLSFDVAGAPLTDPRHRGLSATSAATLVASWSGNYISKKSGASVTCRYTGTRVNARVSARLAKGRAANTLELTLHPRGSGFFPDEGHRAVVRCGAGTVQSAPPHFAPSWFFRDNLQDHGRLTSGTAIVVLPGKLLPNGSAKVAFPKETGRNDSVAVGHIKWSNSGATTVRAR
jgi:hypothetical protein